MGLNPNIWLPKLKFTLQTMAVTYPDKPNDVSIKKYYDFIQNLPIFIPMEPFGKEFIVMLDKYPVTPYLSSRLSFMKWIHFIFNKINEKLEKPQEDFYESLRNIMMNINQKNYKTENSQKRGKSILILLFVL